MRNSVHGFYSIASVFGNFLYIIMPTVLVMVMGSLPGFGQCTFDFMNTTPVSCFGSADGTAEVIASTSNPPFTYLWDDPMTQTTQMATGLAAGVYTVSVSDNAGCSFQEIAIISEPAPISIFVTSNDPADCGVCNGAVDLQVTGGTQPYLYEWSNGIDFTTSQTGLCAGNYCFSVTDANGCTETLEVTVVNLTSTLSAFVTVNSPVSCFGASDGQATVSAMGGTQPYTYLWDSGWTGITTTDLNGGMHSITVVDNTGCSFVDNCFVIEEPDELVASAVLLQNVACFNENNGQAQASASGGTPPYTYQWDEGSTTAISTVLDEGFHVVTVTDNNLCTSTASVMVFQPDMLSIFIQNNNEVSCFGGNDGSATVMVSGGTLPYSYVWSNGFSGQTATTLTEGIYEVTVTDANGCNATQVTGIIEPPPLEAENFFVTEPSCFGGTDGSIDLDVAGGTPPYSFAWQLDGIFFSTDEDPAGLSTGTYDVVVTDNNGCTTTGSVMMSEPDELLVFNTNTISSTCGNNDGFIEIFITGGVPPYTYNWSTGETVQNLNGIPSGLYSVSVNDMNSCETILENIAISDSDGPGVDIGPDLQVCPGDPIQVNPTVTGASGSELYLWVPANILDNPNIPNPVITPVQDTTLYLTIIDGNCTVIDDVFVDVVEFSITAEMTSPEGCGGLAMGEILVNTSGGIPPFQFSLNLTDWQASNVFSNLGAANYVVYATDALGCQAQTNVTVTEGAPGLPVIIAIPPVFNSIYTCDEVLPQATVTLFISGGQPYITQANYIITVSGTTLGDDVVSFAFPGMVGGDVQYTFNVADGDNWTATVYDELGCQFDMITDIFEYNFDCQDCINPFDVTADAGEDQVICGSGTVQLGGNPAGSSTTGSETYTWSPATNLNDPTVPNPFASPVTTTVYTLTVTDINGCYATDEVVVLVSPEIEVSNPMVNNIFCPGSANGSIDFDPTGGTPPFAYVWSGPNGYSADQPPPIQNLEFPGEYCLEITDAFGCQLTDCFTVDVSFPFILAFITQDDCGDDDGYAEVYVPGGDLPGAYTYEWTNGWSTSALPGGLDSGIYCVTVTDSNFPQCSNSSCVEIFEADCVWAGDANYDGIANNDDVLALGLAGGETGPVRIFNFPEWVGVPADDWPGSFATGVNHKHADCDGNGIVNQDDTLAISINYNMTHTVNFGPEGTQGAPPLTFVIEPDTVGPSDLVRVDIHYGETSQPVNNLYGIALTVDYDADFVVPGSVTCDFSESWIGNANETVWLSKELNGMVDLAISRTDQTNVSGFGLIGTIYMVIEDNVDGFAPMDQVEMILDFLDVNAISYDENEIPFSLTQGTLVIDPELTSIANPWLEKQVDIYPNPTDGKVMIGVRNVSIESVQVFDILGKMTEVKSQTSVQTLEVNLGHLHPGPYLVRINTDQGAACRRILVIR